ncbi:hypothetical protein VCR26J2_350752 [Vibrio coralliirubri]|nr:hypothetical protein VCR6J2_370013 [Vibrio coralliirubri]CDT72981.1 hypothetical protein VCR26J2_350752 [Vibrio coralliirubri]
MYNPFSVLGKQYDYRGSDKKALRKSRALDFEFTHKMSNMPLRR